MNFRDLWLAKAAIDLALYAAKGVRELVRGKPKPRLPEPKADPPMPLSTADVMWRENMIKAGARAFVDCQACGESVPSADWLRHQIEHASGKRPILSPIEAFERHVEVHAPPSSKPVPTPKPKPDEDP